MLVVRMVAGYFRTAGSGKQGDFLVTVQFNEFIQRVSISFSW